MTQQATSAYANNGNTSEAADFGFEANVEQLLEMMTHSVYTERSVFLRELISNAADACEKLRFETLSNDRLATVANAPLITISVNKDERCLTIEDNGVGMSRNDLISALGSIASSGTRAYLDQIKNESGAENKEPGANFIGRFGVGFYSAFMVADRVDVFTRRAGEEKAWVWSSHGKGHYTITPLELCDAPITGSRIVLHMNSESDEFLDPWRIESIVKEHSSAIATPIDLTPAPSEETKRIANGSALWTRQKSEITEKEYQDFYQQISGQFDEAALTIHWRAEGRSEYTVLAFVPGTKPFDLFDPARKSRSKLYVRRVLISNETELLPSWLRFIRLVVDSADVPLNVSRETAQKSPVISSMSKAISTKILQELTKLSENTPEKFTQIWNNFGSVIKEGLHEDPNRRDAIFAIARFATSKSDNKTRTLKDYIAELRENQTAIYYITGDDTKRLASSPHIEGFNARGIEVLLLDDPVDAFWVTSALGYDGKPFKSITQGLAEIDSIALLDQSSNPPETVSEVAELVGALKETLADHLGDVRISTRLTESPACLVAADTGLDRQLSRLLADKGQQGGYNKPILEINPTHEAVTALAMKFANKGLKDTQEDMHLLLDLARIADGDLPIDTVSFTKSLASLIAKNS